MTDADKLRKLIAALLDRDSFTIPPARLDVVLRAGAEPLADWMEAALNPGTTAAQLDSAEDALLSALSAALKEQQP